VLQKLRWSERDVIEFIGRELTEPKPQVVFDRPSRPLTSESFVRHAMRKGLRLDLRTRMLICRKQIFINGEAARCDKSSLRILGVLAHSRELSTPIRTGRPTWKLLYDWYRSGYVGIATAAAAVKE
jgi:50S ribosomal protein L16 3-hydroxylase